MRLYKGAQLIGVWFALFSANASVVAQIAIAVDGAPKTIPLVNVGKSVNAGGNGKDGLFQQSSTNILPGQKVTLTPGRFALLTNISERRKKAANRTTVILTIGFENSSKE